jgi:hypothetical protein
MAVAGWRSRWLGGHCTSPAWASMWLPRLWSALPHLGTRLTITQSSLTRGSESLLSCALCPKSAPGAARGCRVGTPLGVVTRHRCLRPARSRTALRTLTVVTMGDAGQAPSTSRRRLPEISAKRHDRDLAPRDAHSMSHLGCCGDSPAVDGYGAQTPRTETARRRSAC